jgi:hypothetical protein
MRSACGSRATPNRLWLTPRHWLSLSSVTTFDIAWMRPIRARATLIHVGPWRGARHDRLDHGEDVLTRWLAFDDGQPPLETNADLNRG